MNKKIGVLLGILFFFFLSAYFGLCHAYPRYQEARREKALEARLRSIASSLTLEQKVGQIIHVGMPGLKVNPVIQKEINAHCVGGVILFGHNLKSFPQIQKLTAGLQKLAVARCAGVPLYISADEEGGRVYRTPLQDLFRFPGAMAVGQAGDPELAREVGFITAYNLGALGINMVLAPVLDVNNNPGNPVINTRSFGSAPERVTRMGTALARGIREANSLPVIKHFPGHGDTFVDSHLALPRINKNLAELEKTELIPFRAAIQNGAEVVMSAHILYPSLDEKYPATLSSVILTGLLRKKMGFRGLIMTDAMEMHAIAKNYKRGQAAVRALRAGADIILLTGAGPYVREIYSALLQAVRADPALRARLEDAVLRQLRFKLRRGLIYREARTRFSFNPELTEYFRAREARSREERLRLKKKYAARSLNEVVSERSIASLRKVFPGGASGNTPDFKSQSKKVRLFYKTTRMSREARRKGWKKSRLRAGGTYALRRYLPRARGDEILLVEVRAGDLRVWNALVRKLNARNRRSRTGSSPNRRGAPLVIALYPDNPFLNIKIPERGAVLASFSPTGYSLRALLQRALDGRPVQKARLILTPER